ncbi:MAG: hypothetical protein AB8F34_07050 [Akkermansiaceae bacterium]
MRGLPPFQALLLLIVLTVLGYAGSRFISLGVASTPAAITTEPEAAGQTVEAEIEFVFSSPPLSYKLIKPSVTGGEDVVLVKSSQTIENPCYGSVKLTAHRLSTYWLDVRWKHEPAENSQHFVRINISPSHGESRAYAYFSGQKEIEETFDYSTGGSPHE